MVANENTKVLVALERLKIALETIDEKKFEELASDLFSLVLRGVTVATSKSGQQFGADGGTSGSQGRHLRIECKRYRETTPLSQRELAGELVQAILRTPDLEAWVLFATKRVKENERDLAQQVALKEGIPIVIIDWSPAPINGGIPHLAVVCAAFPETVERYLGGDTGDLCRELAKQGLAYVSALQREFDVWNIGYENLRAKAAMHLERIWTDGKFSRSVLNQDVAGGRSGVNHVLRRIPQEALTGWWRRRMHGDATSIAVLAGDEGVGKTWLVLDWLIREIKELPLVLMVPASAFANGRQVYADDLLLILSRALQAALGTHQAEAYWVQRMRAVLARSEEEGPAVLLVVDGLNQQPHTEWISLANRVQGANLFGGLSLLVTCRTSYFERDLRRFGNTDDRPVVVPVGPYDDSELDHLLELHGMRRSDMHSTLHKLAAVPRLFPLVCRLKDSVALQSEATVSRLLFEYGRDSLQQRQGSTITGDAWVDWLVACAERYRASAEGRPSGIRGETYEEVSDSLDAPHLSREDVARRLSDIVDGRLMREVKFGFSAKMTLSDDAVPLALGLSLLESLSRLEDQTVTSTMVELDRWLDPIAAIDLVADVMQSALAVAMTTEAEISKHVVEAILVTWMHAQNPSNTFEVDVAVFGGHFPLEMLGVIEHSSNRNHELALELAVDSVRRSLIAGLIGMEAVLPRLESWVQYITLPDANKVDDPNHYASSELRALQLRLGDVAPGDRLVLGVSFKFAHQCPTDAADSIPRILEGTSLLSCRSLLKTLAVHRAIQAGVGSHWWMGFSWLAFLCETETERLQELLNGIVDELMTTVPEPGVNPALRNRASEYLLRMQSNENMEVRANDFSVSFDDRWSYQEYLDNPGKSYFSLERRHLELALLDESLDANRRIERIKPFLADPTVEIQGDLAKDLRTQVAAIDFGEIRTGRFAVKSDIFLQRLAPTAARFISAEYCDLMRERLDRLSEQQGEGAYGAVSRAVEMLLVANPVNCEKFRNVRVQAATSHEEASIATLCLILELSHLTFDRQVDVLVIDAENFSFSGVMPAIRPASADALAQAMKRHKENREKIARVVLHIIAYQAAIDAEPLVDDLEWCLTANDVALREIAFRALATHAPVGVGKRLLKMSWTYATDDRVCGHLGSVAICAATRDLPISDVLSMVAPWLWLDFAADRDASSEDLREISEAILTSLIGAPDYPDDLGASVSVRVSAEPGPEQVYLSELPGSEDDAFKRLAETPEQGRERMKRLVEQAIAAIKRTRDAGGAFFLHLFRSQAVKKAYLAAPDVWSRTLDGMEEGAAHFKKRVQAAEGLYTALCEVLLELEPERGAVLWQRLHQFARTPIQGRSGLPELSQIAFRAPDSASVGAIRGELATFEKSSTDQKIFDLVVLAQVNSQEAWLANLIASDARSGVGWRQKRSIAMDAIASHQEVGQMTWPQGEKSTSWQSLRSHYSLWTNRWTLARYWWAKFVTATNSDDAFCAWKIFLECVDKRCLAMVTDWLDNQKVISETDRMRRLHVVVLWTDLKRAIQDAERSSPRMDEHLFMRDLPSKFLRLDRVVGEI